MNRAIINFIVDAAAFAAFLFLSTTGALMRYVLPPGSGHFSTLWGMDRNEQLGRLRKKYGFEMEAVRKAVQTHNDQQDKRGKAP